MSPVATVFVPGSIGNVGPGFDVLGLAVDGIGDKITVELVDGPSRVASVTGRDADAVPLSAEDNCCTVAANSLLHRIGDHRLAVVSINRALPLAGGLGASAAASVGGAYAAALASGKNVPTSTILTAALDGEDLVSSRHLDNIAPSLLGGLTIARSNDPAEAVRVPIKGEWWVAVVSPAVRLTTKKARSVLPQLVTQADFVQQMANTASLVTAFSTGDHELARHALVDLYAEPRRAALIGSFYAVKQAALTAGALGCTISGAGPSVFALLRDEPTAIRVAKAMQTAFFPVEAQFHVGRVATEGARPV